jgi:Zn ribbon nucleic-acid-binding protein
MSDYRPSIGDVVLDNGFPVVVVNMINYEDCGSCGYDRKYLLCKEEYLKNNQGIVTIKDLEQHGRWVSINGSVFPDIQKVDAIAPYNINKIECVKISQKVAKTVTVYE